jgi:hypothetical protein
MPFPLVSQVASIVSQIREKEDRVKVAGVLLSAAEDDSECFFNEDALGDNARQAIVAMHDIGAIRYSNFNSYKLAPELRRGLKEFSLSSEGHLSGTVSTAA